MKLIGSSEKFGVYDEVFTPEEQKMLWQYVQDADYTTPHAGKWTKVWRLNDALVMGGTPSYYSHRPFGNALDLITFYAEKFADRHDFLTEWSEISIRPYLYPRNTKLSWHNDAGYAGALIFYVHPYWSSSWGGELMIAQTPPGGFTAPHLDRADQDRFLEMFGMGQYISAKPNRAVITGANVWHAINRVDADAGDNIRASIVCFFMKDKK